LGVVRLISSASRKLVNTGPGLNSKASEQVPAREQADQREAHDFGLAADRRLHRLVQFD
jgi:hypothetical protein